MITIKDAITTAIVTSDAVLAGKISDMLRYDHGMDYDQTYKLVNEAHPIGAEEWDELLYAADEIDSRQ